MDEGKLLADECEDLAHGIEASEWVHEVDEYEALGGVSERCLRASGSLSTGLDCRC